MERDSISSRARITIGSASCFIFLSLYIVPLVLEGLLRPIPLKRPCSGPVRLIWAYRMHHFSREGRERSSSLTAGVFPEHSESPRPSR
jgi:hypothetical protein